MYMEKKNKNVYETPELQLITLLGDIVTESTVTNGGQGGSVGSGSLDQFVKPQ